MIWTKDLVWRREVEAQDTIARLPRDDLARLKAFWPEIRRDFADAVAAEETREAEGYPWAPSWRRPGPPTPSAIDRMEEVWDWHEKYLANDVVACRVLQGMALAQAIGKPLLWGVRGKLRTRRYTAYRLRDRALLALVRGLGG